METTARRLKGEGGVDDWKERGTPLLHQRRGGDARDKGRQVARGREFHHLAQGCEERATLGIRTPKNSQR
jgi:hypothetical protein